MYMEILGMPLYGDEWGAMILKLAVNILFTTILVRYLYYPSTQNKNYLFSYFMISVVVFFLCFTLRQLELDMGMALGMFAIFAIIRYRTDAIPVKEMTYLFMIIGIAVINGLANERLPLMEVLFANAIITLGAWFIERFWLSERLMTKLITYEEIANITPTNRQLLIADLEKRTGLDIQRVEVGDINFLRDTAEITIYFKPN